MTFPGGENENDNWQEGDGEQPWNADEPVSDEQLSLTGEDDALPWLTGDDYDDEEQRGGTDYRILVFAVLALALLGAILWGAKTFFDRNGGNSADLVADGSTVSAPDGDYKERPADPGGQDVAGTGDLAYEVGEGVNREGRVGDAPAAPSPSVDVAQGDRPSALAPAASPAPRASASGAARPAATAAATSGGVGVQVGAFQTRASAESGWQQLSGRYSALQGVNHRIVEGTVDSGTIYRLQAVAANAAAADALCRSIRNAGGDCQVKR